MKTNYLTYASIAILTAFLISSCTVDEDFCDLENASQPASKERTVQDNSSDSKEEIIFNVKSGNAARSESEYSNVTKFKITAYEDGFNYYDGRTDEVTTSDNGMSWTSDCDRYWPGNRPSNWKGLTFYAFTECMSNNMTHDDNNADINLDCSYSIPIIKNFKVNDEVTKQRELMYAVASEVKNTNVNGEVNLNFNHALSRVNFTAANNDPNISNIEILSIELGGVKGEGDYQFPDFAAMANKSVVFESDCQGKWIIQEGTKNQSYKLNDLSLNIGTSGTSNSCVISEEMYLIPQKVAEIKDKSSLNGGYVKVTVKTISKGSSSANATKDYILPISIDWREGKTYTYNINWTSNFTIISCRESNS